MPYPAKPRLTLKSIGAGRVRIHGREYRSLVVSVKKRMIRAHGRLYPHYSITIPKPIGDWLLEQERHFVKSLSEPLRSELIGEEPEKLEAIILIGSSDWYHGLLWESLPMHSWERLAPSIRGELEALGLGLSREEVVLIPARRGELEALGIDPDKPVTLEDIRRARRNT